MTSNKKVSGTPNLAAINQAPPPGMSCCTRPTKSKKPISASQPVNQLNAAPVTIQQPGDPDVIENSQASRPCELCRTNISDDQLTTTVLQCCLCDLLFHGVCCDIDDSLMEFIHVVNEIGGWCCKSCRTSKRGKNTKVPPKLTQKNADNITAIQLEMSKINEQISSISKGLDKLTSIAIAPKVTKLSDMLKTPVVPAPPCIVSDAEALQSGNVNSKQNLIPYQTAKHSTSSGMKKNSHTAVLSAVHEEFSSIAQRSHNVVVSGLPTNNQTNDSTLFEELCFSMLDITPHVKSTYRFGKQSSAKPQLLLVTLGSAETADAILKNAIKLGIHQRKCVHQQTHDEGRITCSI